MKLYKILCFLFDCRFSGEKYIYIHIVPKHTFLWDEIKKSHHTNSNVFSFFLLNFIIWCTYAFHLLFKLNFEMAFHCSRAPIEIVRDFETWKMCYLHFAYIYINVLHIAQCIYLLFLDRFAKHLEKIFI